MCAHSLDEACCAELNRFGDIVCAAHRGLELCTTFSPQINKEARTRVVNVHCMLVSPDTADGRRLVGRTELARLQKEGARAASVGTWS